MKPRFLHRPFLLLAALAGLAATPLAQGSTIFWGSDFPDLLFDASEQPLGPEFSFELGTFGGGFSPTLANINDWAANWKVFDRAYDATPGDNNDPDSEGWDSVTQSFVGTVNHTVTNGSSSPDANPADFFGQGEIVYLWVYNTKDRNTGTEWALVTDGGSGNDQFSDWVMPDPTDTGSYDWMLADADLAIVGGVDGTLSNNGDFKIQTSLIPVPEPGSALLAGLAVLGALAQRRRKGVNASIN